MSMIQKIRNAVTGGDWFVAYRSENDGKWRPAGAPENQWCADPFIFEDHGEHYIFVEQYLKEKDKGCIGYFQFEDGKPVNKGIIIENSYHMSYPDVFRYGNEYYMIPESSANNTVDLYRADRFPDRWEKAGTLISGKKYVDSTVFRDGDQWYLISYTMTGGYELHVFSLDVEKREVTLLSRKRYDQNTGRPGGRLFEENGRLMRPAQDCSRKYGEALIICQVDALNQDGEYLEHEVRRIRAEDLKMDNGPERLHQLTRDGMYSAADVYKERFDPLHFVRILIRSHRK